MATKCIIVCHDIGLSNLLETVQNSLVPANPDFKFVQYEGINFNNLFGTGFFYRGFSSGEMERLASLGSLTPIVFKAR